jgi:membrane-associated phospholipid phosphatase
MAKTKPGNKRVKKVTETLLEGDAATAEKVKPYQRSAPVRALAWLSELGDQPQMITLSAATIAAGLAGRNARLTRAGIRMIAAHYLATAAKNFVKVRIDRTRPRSADPGNDGHHMKPGDKRAKEETSFPSGHSAGAMAVARAFSREYPEYRGPALTAAGLIALAQIPRCAHYPTDVGAGLAIGLASEVAVNLAADALQEKAPFAGPAGGHDVIRD